MGAYQDAIDQQYISRLRQQIGSLLGATQPGMQLPTIFLFPGGLASNLDRALEPASWPFHTYYQTWLNPSVLLGSARVLQMVGDDDLDDQYIVPDGPVTFAMNSCGGFLNWCGAIGVNVFVVAWDWRRGTDAAANFFLNVLLPEVENQASQLGAAANPLDNAWLVGHSFGGMVVKRILNETNNDYVQQLKGAITVATPFYGSGGQLHRFFIGEDDINCTLWPDGAATCTRIVSTMPANYEIQFLSYPTYAANEAQFSQDEFPLNAYPSMDGSAAGTPADPYNPQPAPAGWQRYLSGYNFSNSLLTRGAAAVAATSQALDPTVAAKFWNIRAVTTAADGVTPLDNTSVGHLWSLAPANFDPDVGPDPVVDKPGPGDSVVPAWSGRLLGLPTGHVFTLRGQDLEHPNLMNTAQVQTQIAQLLNLPAPVLQLADANAVTRHPAIAARTDLDAFKAEVRRELDKAGPSPFARRRAFLEILQSQTLERREELIGRGVFDVYKAPKLRGETKDKPAK